MRYYFAFVIILFSCSQRDSSEVAIKSKFKTKGEFKCKLTVDKSEYIADSLKLALGFRDYIDAKESPFNAPAYDSLTVVLIDTIIYSPDLNYCAVLAMEKCLDKESKSWSYDGGVHFASKIKDTVSNTTNWKIFSRHGARHILAENYEKMSDILRENNLIYRAYEADKNKTSGFNIDDCRFWTSPYFVNQVKADGFIDLGD